MSFALVVSVIFGLSISVFLYNLSGVSRMSLSTRMGFTTHPGSRRNILSEIEKTFNRIALKFQAKSTHKVSQALFELPEVLDLLVVSLRSGEGIFQSLRAVTPRAHGELAKELSKCLLAVDYGAALPDEIRKLPKLLPHPQFAEFANKIVLSLARGTPLATMLEDQAKSARSEIGNQLLRQAGKNETRMLMPLVFLILPVIVLFAIYPSLKLLNFGFI